MNTTSNISFHHTEEAFFNPQSSKAVSASFHQAAPAVRQDHQPAASVLPSPEQLFYQQVPESGKHLHSFLGKISAL